MIVRDVDTKSSKLLLDLNSQGSFDSIIKGYSFNFQISVHEAFAHFPKFKPHLIVVDDSVKDILSFKKIRFQYPSLLLLFLVEDEDLFFNKIISFGIDGAIEKNAGIDEFFLAIENLKSNRVYLSPLLLRKTLKSFERNHSSVLTTREIHILKLMSLGYTYKKVADSMQISSETVKTHNRNIYRKLGVNTKQEAIAFVLKEKLI